MKSDKNLYENKNIRHNNKNTPLSFYLQVFFSSIYLMHRLKELVQLPEFEFLNKRIYSWQKSYDVARMGPWPKGNSTLCPWKSTSKSNWRTKRLRSTVIKLEFRFFNMNIPSGIPGNEIRVLYALCNEGESLREKKTFLTIYAEILIIAIYCDLQQVFFLAIFMRPMKIFFFVIGFKYKCFNCFTKKTISARKMGVGTFNSANDALQSLIKIFELYNKVLFCIFQH